MNDEEIQVNIDCLLKTKKLIDGAILVLESFLDLHQSENKSMEAESHD